MADQSPHDDDSSTFCTLWVHDGTFAEEPVIFNPAALDDHGARFHPGVLVKARAKLESGIIYDAEKAQPTIWGAPMFFVVEETAADILARQPKLQLSVSQTIADLFNITRGSEMALVAVDQDAEPATHVEISFRDVYVTRADMRRMFVSSLVRTAVHAGQQLLLAGCVRANVCNIYRHGRKVDSAFVTAETKPVFRSESSRFIIYIQMSREMWDFDEHGSGDIMFNKVVEGVLPKLFKKWYEVNARHMVSIVMFTRVEMQGQAEPFRDFYRVVIGEMSSFEWNDILHQLKLEFQGFLRDILLFNDTNGNATEAYVAGKPSAAKHGNILEAINTATSPFSKDWIDVDLFRTGLSILVITPGTGVFEVDQALLNLTTESLVNNGINIDLVCLARPPLHSVPLFQYKTSSATNVLVSQNASHLSREHSKVSKSRFRERWVSVVPQWMHVHFWGADNEHGRRLTCFLYDLSMTGIIESEMNNVAVPSVTVSNEKHDMDDYDRKVFSEKEAGPRQGPSIARHASRHRDHDSQSVMGSLWANEDPDHSPTRDKAPIVRRFEMEQSDQVNPEKQRPSLSGHGRTASNSTTRSSRFDFRSLLGSARGIGIVKAGASALPTLLSGSPSSVSTKPYFEDESPRQPNLVSQHVRTSLSRQPTSSTLPRPLSSSSTFSGTTMETTPDHASHISTDEDKVKTKEQPVPETSKIMATPNDLDIDKSLAGSDLPRSLALWLDVTDPAKARDRKHIDHGWAHAFTHSSQGWTLRMKWKSLCTPAALPLASDLKFRQSLLSSYEERDYKIALDEDDETSLAETRGRLLSNLVAFRLSKGFQVIANVSTSAGAGNSRPMVAFDSRMLADDGRTLTLVKGNMIHVLCASGSDIQVTRYEPRSSFVNEQEQFKYLPYIKSTLEPDYARITTWFSLARDSLNWSMIDNHLAGHLETTSTSPGHWRARFVLIPVDPPRHSRRSSRYSGEETVDEMRVEGIQRLSQVWDRLRVQDGSRTSLEAKHATSNPNPLDLEFQTRDASVVLSAGLGDSRLIHGSSLDTSTRLFSKSGQQNSERFDLHKLASELQGEEGIDIRDRGWYLSMHRRSFLGSDLTTWLWHRFADVSTREDAVKLGGRLLEKRVIKHVRGTHSFKDGNYFYTFTSEYQRPTPAPASPLSKQSAASPNEHSKLLASSNSPRLSKAKAKDTLPHKPRVALTACIQCDVDTRRKSGRPEIVNLHYDRLFNPESCYHFRLEWMDATAKLIEETISSWATTAERYGLKLVQVPIAEASRIAEYNPFRTPSITSLAVAPPQAEPDYTRVDSNTPAPLSTSRYHPYQRALLKKFDFVLESEAAANFPLDIEVKMTYAHEDYRLSQYIHKSGLCLAQVDAEGRFLIVANRLANNRATFGRDAANKDKRDVSSRGSTVTAASTAQGSRPGSSALSRSQFLFSATPSTRSTTAGADPMIAAMRQNLRIDKSAVTLTAEQIKEQLDNFCSNPEALSDFYAAASLSTRDAAGELLASPRQGPLETPGQTPDQTPSGTPGQTPRQTPLLSPYGTPKATPSVQPSSIFSPSSPLSVAETSAIPPFELPALRSPLVKPVDRQQEY